jgi:hypothetical protein
MQEGTLGFSGVAPSLPTEVGAQGEVLEPELSGEGHERLQHSADLLRQAAIGAGLA